METSHDERVLGQDGSSEVSPSWGAMGVGERVASFSVSREQMGGLVYFITCVIWGFHLLHVQC